jgi:hypothetical protein
MRRTIAYLEYKARWWTLLTTPVKSTPLDTDISALNTTDQLTSNGAIAYAHRQHFQYTSLATRFRELWAPILTKNKLGKP